MIMINSIHSHAHTHAHTLMYTHTCTHTYTHIHAHTHTHTHNAHKHDSYKKCCRRGHKGGFEFTYGVVYREHGSDYVVHNELANIDETSVQSMKLTFLDQESQKSTPEPPSEKEELGSEDIVTAL